MINRIFSFMLLSSVLFAGCKKEETILEKGVVYTGSPLVNFNNYGGYAKENIEIADKWIPFDYEVKLTNTLEAAKVPITVTVQKDENPIGEYNTLNGTSLVPVPMAALKIENFEVVIVKGARKAIFHFEINPSKLDLSKTYGFGFSILKVTGGGVQVNSNDEETRMLIELGTLNAYDGVYSLKGEFKFHPSFAGPFLAGETIELQTSGATSVNQFCTIWNEYCQPFSVTPGNPTDLNRFGGIAVSYTVNPATNAVTVSAGPGNTTALEFVVAGYNSRYDPATKTMFVSWGYRNAAGALRQFIDTLAFVRKR